MSEPADKHQKNTGAGVPYFPYKMRIALVYEAIAIVLIASAIVILRLRHSDKLGLKKRKSK